MGIGISSSVSQHGQTRTPRGPTPHVSPLTLKVRSALVGLIRCRLKHRWEEGSGWRIHVNPWLIHVNVWQKPLQYSKLISLQLIKINGKKKKKKKENTDGLNIPHPRPSLEKPIRTH